MLFIYNYIKRPWYNLITRIMWHREGKPTPMLPQAGIVTKEDLAWAKQTIQTIKK